MTINSILSILGSVIGLLLSILVGLGAWNLNATRATAEAVARMEERVFAADARATDVRTRLADVETRIQSLEVRLAELRQKGGTP